MSARQTRSATKKSPVNSKKMQEKVEEEREFESKALR